MVRTVVSEFWDKASKGTETTGKDLNSLACEQEVAPSPHDRAKESAASSLEINRLSSEQKKKFIDRAEQREDGKF